MSKKNKNSVAISGQHECPDVLMSRVILNLPSTADNWLNFILENDLGYVLVCTICFLESFTHRYTESKNVVLIWSRLLIPMSICITPATFRIFWKNLYMPFQDPLCPFVLGGDEKLGHSAGVLHLDDAHPDILVPLKHLLINYFPAHETNRMIHHCIFGFTIPTAMTLVQVRFPDRLFQTNPILMLLMLFSVVTYSLAFSLELLPQSQCHCQGHSTCSQLVLCVWLSLASGLGLLLSPPSSWPWLPMLLYFLLLTLLAFAPKLVPLVHQLLSRFSCQRCVRRPATELR